MKFSFKITVSYLKETRVINLILHFNEYYINICFIIIFNIKYKY